MSATRPSLWRNRDYNLLWGGQAASALGQQMSGVAYPLLILAGTHSAIKVGAVATGQSVATYVGGLLGGPWVDRANRRVVIAVCDAVRAVAVAAVAVIVLLRVAAFGVVLGTAVVGSFFAVPVTPATDAALVRIVADEQLDQAVAQDQARVQGASFAGPGLGGLLFGVGASIPFLVNVATYAASVVGALGIRTSLAIERSSAAREGFRHELTAGWRWLIERKRLTILVTSLAFLNLSVSGVEVLVIVLARHDGASPFEVGLSLAISAAGGIAGAVFAPRLIERVGKLGAVLLAVWGVTVLIPALAVAPGFVGLGATFGLMTLVLPPANVVLISKLLRMLPDDLRGRVVSVVVLLNAGLGALGPLLAGVLVEALGSSAALPLTAPALLTALIISTAPKLRAFIAEPDEPEAKFA